MTSFWAAPFTDPVVVCAGAQGGAASSDVVSLAQAARLHLQLTVSSQSDWRAPWLTALAFAPVSPGPTRVTTVTASIGPSVLPCVTWRRFRGADTMTDAQSKAAVEAIYRRHRSAVYGYLLMRVRGDEKLAEDLCNETFLEVWRKIDRYRNRVDDPSLRKILFRMAYCNMIDDYRKHRRRIELVESVEEIPSGKVVDLPLVVTDPLAGVVSKEFLTQFWLKLRQRNSRTSKGWLTDMEYRVALLAWREDRPIDRIARDLGIGENAVSTHMSRARTKLRALIESDTFQLEFGPIEAPQKNTHQQQPQIPYDLGQVARSAE
ncbi:RNA polymerase sigma factor [Nocardia sp. NPDC055029]